ncbi:MAG TPA: hypothetical protein VLB84_15355 [Bacteroidia bacterium]|jgi:hypothetical protein|nr:hypothetical protein [Bacteroidia bacterium]
MKVKNETVILVLSFIIALISGGTSLIGGFSENFYSKENLNWQVQSITQDYINLFIVLILLFSAWMNFKKKKYGQFMWVGTILYLIYTYLIYCFDVHFNELFTFYCIILGLCFYSLLYFLYSQRCSSLPGLTNSKMNKIIGWYFLFISVLFYFLWLSDIIKATVSSQTPSGLNEINIPTNPVHVIDLSVFLPGTFITGILTLQNKPIGHWLSPVILTFFILMDVTICIINLAMVQKNITNQESISVIMIVFAFISLFLLISNMRTIKFEQ